MDPADLCPRPLPLPPLATTPHAPPIYPAQRLGLRKSRSRPTTCWRAAWRAMSISATAIPTPTLLAEKCRLLHAAERAAITASGMGALAAAMLSQLSAGDHAVDRQPRLWQDAPAVRRRGEAAGDRDDGGRYVRPGCRRASLEAEYPLVVAETIANPLLEVADIAALAEIAHRRKASRYSIDNTFASPILCRPLELGADLVMESLTKTMNGHSDVILGLLGGSEAVWPRVPQVISAWGLVEQPVRLLAGRAGPGDGSSADRAGLRERAGRRGVSCNRNRRRVAKVYYPGLTAHPQHALAARQFGGRFGTMVAFRTGRRPARGRCLHRRGEADSLLPVARRAQHDAQPSRNDQPPRPDRRPASGPGHHRRHDSPFGRHRIGRVHPRGARRRTKGAGRLTS